MPIKAVLRSRPTLKAVVKGINGGTNTNDATATAEDILKGASAYVKGQKVTGTHVCEEGIDTSDATAVAADISKGKTAYVDGAKVTGTHECEVTTLGARNIVANGEYIAANDGYDGYSTVHVDVPAPELVLQNRVVTPTTETQTVKPDEGYDGLRQVAVNAIKTETKNIRYNGTYTPTEGSFFSEVTVSVLDAVYEAAETIELATRNLTQTTYSASHTYSTEIEVVDDAVKMVNATTIKPIYLSSYQEYKDCYFRLSGTIYYIPADAVYAERNIIGAANAVTGYRVVCTNAQKVVVGSSGPVLQSKTITENGEYMAADDSLDGYSSVTVNVQPALQSLVTVTPDSAQHVIDPEDGFYGLRRVVVNPVPTQEKTATANGEVTPDSGKFLSKVTVNVPPSGVDTSDATATASDIAKDKTAYVGGQKVIGTHECETGATGGSVVKTGTTTSATIDTGLSEIEYLFIYRKTAVSSGGLISLHYHAGEGTSTMWASQWSTTFGGSKTVTHDNTNATVDGGNFTHGKTLSSGVTYYWTAVGKE